MSEMPESSEVPKPAEVSPSGESPEASVAAEPTDTAGPDGNGGAAAGSEATAVAEAPVAEAARVGEALGTGRRKTSVARVRVRPGGGKIAINGRELGDYFHNLHHRNAVLAPLEKTGKRAEVDVLIRVCGGGITGQADACKLGIARALKTYDPAQEEILREAELLTRDGRMKERKKYGLHGARRGTQFSKR